MSATNLTQVSTELQSLIRDFLAERITAQELTRHGISGAIRTDRSFIGYDYRNQQWIDSREFETDPLALSAAAALRGEE